MRAPHWNLSETGPLPDVLSDLIEFSSVVDAIGPFAKEVLGGVDCCPDVANITRIVPAIRLGAATVPPRLDR